MKRRDASMDAMGEISAKILRMDFAPDLPATSASASSASAATTEQEDANHSEGSMDASYGNEVGRGTFEAFPSMIKVVNESS